jgi:hypothetical protein
MNVPIIFRHYNAMVQNNVMKWPSQTKDNNTGIFYFSVKYWGERKKLISLESAYLLTLPLCTGVSCVRALSPAWTGSDINLPHTPFPPAWSPLNKKFVYFLQSPYLFTIDRLFPWIVEMFRINFYRVSLDFSFRNMKLIVVYVIERITIRNAHSRWVLFRFSFK